MAEGEEEAVGELENQRVVAGGRGEGPRPPESRIQMLRNGWGVQHNCRVCLSSIFPESPLNTV